MSYTFDVIIPTFNNLPDLKQCLEGFSKQTFKDFRVIVCVDGSTDGTNEYLDSEKFEFSLLKLTHPNGINMGRDETRNLALPEINSKFLLFIDSDIFSSENLLLKHYDLLKTHDNSQVRRSHFYGCI